MYTVYMDLEIVYSSHMSENDLRKLIDETIAKQAKKELNSPEWHFHEGQLDILYDILQGKFY